MSIASSQISGIALSEINVVLGGAISLTGGTTDNIKADGSTRTITWLADVTNANNKIAHIFDNTNNLTNSGTKIVSWRLAGVEKTYLDKTGNFSANDFLAAGQVSAQYLSATQDVTCSADMKSNGALKVNGAFDIGTKTIDAVAGDAATINAISGRFRKDTSGAVFTLTNSYIVDADTIVILQPANAAIDATATSWTIVCAAGSATITFNAAPTANFDMNFLITN